MNVQHNNIEVNKERSLRWFGYEKIMRKKYNSKNETGMDCRRQEDEGETQGKVDGWSKKKHDPQDLTEEKETEDREL